jgi:hypothetical protein
MCKNTYKVTIKEVLSKDVEIQASDVSEALNIAIEMYKKSEIVLSADDFEGKAEVTAIKKVECQI